MGGQRTGGVLGRGRVRWGVVWGLVGALVGPTAGLAITQYRSVLDEQRVAESQAIRADAFVVWLGREVDRRDEISLALARQDVLDQVQAAAVSLDDAQVVLDACPHADEALRAALTAAIIAARSAADAGVAALDLVQMQELRQVVAETLAAAKEALPAVEQSQAAWQASQDARVAAELAAAAEQAARRAASLTTPTGVSASTESGAVWSVSVVNSGGQSTVDACAGGLTRYSFDIEGKPYLPIHINCGGGPVLSLTIGQTVAISGGGLDGTWEVVDSRDVTKGGDLSEAYGLQGGAILQTCYRTGDLMRVVAIVKTR